MISTAKRVGVLAVTLSLVQLTAPDGVFASPAVPDGRASPTVQRDPSRPGIPAQIPAPSQRTTGHPYAAKAPVWPSGSATVALSSSARRAGTLPVSVRAAGAAARATTGAGGASVDLRVEVLDRAATAAAGVHGVVVRLGGPAAGTPVHLDVDYSGFRDGYSGGGSSALRLVSLTGCVPLTAACTVTPLDSTNNVVAGVLSADVTAGATVAAVEAPNGSTGDYTATPLKATSTWQAGGNAGDFNWGYPLRVPPLVNGPSPQLALGYSAHAVDGSMAASNNQPSWVGEGFDLPNNAIERKYVTCGKDMGSTANNTTKTGDLCWKTDNATMTLGGNSTELLKGSDGKWHGRAEDGSRIELKTGAVNGDHDGQWWVVTQTDGTQYWFGRNQLPGWASGKAVTNSVWTVPVFGNNTNEPCHASSFSASACDRAWRWSLDYVIDPFGNTMSYWYGVEKNKYAKAGSATNLATYTRGGWLDRIDYGTRSDTAYATAPLQVDFGDADRCVTANCATHDAANWPDTPWTMECTKSPCTVGSPTFWTAKRLGTITTKVGGKPVDQWSFKHTFPDPGDTTRAGLWLDSISHKGLAGTTDGTRTEASVPDVHFVGVQKPNRVDATDASPAMNWWRIASIENETGGSINVTYSDADCVRGTTRMPDKTALWNNTLRCFPVYWAPNGGDTLTLDYFHKYVVTDVSESDIGLPSDERSVPIVTHYDYLTTPAWRYTDDDGLVDDKAKTWSDWRGYGRVRTTIGQGAEAVRSETVYFRGMDGDKLGTGNRSVTLPAAGDAPAVTDSDFWAGMVREELSYQDATGTEIGATVNVPWRSATATATRTIDGVVAEARFVDVAETHERTALDGGRGWRTTTTRQTFDEYGMVIRAEDLGDDAVTDDQTCTITDYARNVTTWITDTVSREREFVVDCTTAQGTGLTEVDVVSDTYTLYDGGARGAAPTKGAVTETDELAGYPSRYIVGSKTTYDSYGREKTTTDVRGNTTKTSYTPSTGGPVVGIQNVTQLGWVTTSTIDPAWGVPTNVVDPNGKSTRQTYDALGRTTATWLPNRPSTLPATITYAYQVRKTGGSVTVTNKLNAVGDGYVSGAEFFDGQGRIRQTQSVEGSAAGGRVVGDTFYDSAGRTAKQNSAYIVDGGLVVTNPVFLKHPDDTQVPSQTVTAYDGAGRVKRTTFNVNGSERWHTTNAYGGDRTDVIPPAGSMPTSTYADVDGHTTRLRQFHSALGGSDYNDLTYAFDRKGRMSEERDNVGNVWSYGYDFLGRRTSVRHPDAATTTTTYNDAGDVLTSVNEEAQKLVFGYDSIGRKTSERRDSTTGPLLADWGYDTITTGVTTVSVLGHQVRSTSYVGSAAYTTRIDGFTDLYQATGETIVIPPTETGIAGSYSYAFGYTGAGAQESTTMPLLGGLPREKLTTRYNALGEVDTLKTSLSSTGDDVFLINGTGYTRYGELGLISRRNGDGPSLITTYDYEVGTRRLSKIHTIRGTTSSEVADVRYSYDASGNVLEQSELIAGDTQCYNYDYARRLTEAWTPASADCAAARSQSQLGGPAPYWNSYSFDAVGNRTASTERTTTSSVSRAYVYPAAKSAQPHALQSMTTSGAGTTSYTYDKVGRTLTRPANGTSGADQSLTWDPDGRLASSTDTSGTTTYVYDAEGDRLIKREPSGTTLSLPGQELRVANGQSAATRYITHAGHTVAVRTTAGLTWQVDDQQGTGTVEVDATSQAVTKRWFTPFGAARGAAAVWATDKVLVDGTKDGSGLIHLGAREYDQVTGRFISVDPMLDPDDPQQLQAYNYASATPVTLSDPDGLMPWDPPPAPKRPNATRIEHSRGSYSRSHARAPRLKMTRSQVRAPRLKMSRSQVRAPRLKMTRSQVQAPRLGLDSIIDGLTLGLGLAPVLTAIAGVAKDNGQRSGPGGPLVAACGLLFNVYGCQSLWGSFKQRFAEALGPTDCGPECVMALIAIHTYIFTHIELSVGGCMVICLDIEFQGGVIQAVVGVGAPGVGAGVSLQDSTVDEQGPVEAESCALAGVGLCGGVVPLADPETGQSKGLGRSGGVATGVGNYEEYAGYNFWSFDLRTMKGKGLEDPRPALFGKRPHLICWIARC